MTAVCECIFKGVFQCVLSRTLKTWNVSYPKQLQSRLSPCVLLSLQGLKTNEHLHLWPHLVRVVVGGFADDYEEIALVSDTLSSVREFLRQVMTEERELSRF